jgi:hypothetical protein
MDRFSLKVQATCAIALLCAFASATDLPSWARFGNFTVGKTRMNVVRRLLGPGGTDHKYFDTSMRRWVLDDARLTVYSDNQDAPFRGRVCALQIDKWKGTLASLKIFHGSKPFPCGDLVVDMPFAKVQALLERNGVPAFYNGHLHALFSVSKDNSYQLELYFSDWKLFAVSIEPLVPSFLFG